ncbi:hypothetical protein Cgig2_006548 [Carnegiea gigantea]|uniref:Zinc finger PMZ-type domain-containing protein n=1 Tax=Carnegiea gigantea TaxID=171969 RepID=A0A9Q1JVB8_9CARY|nr:hypothetical protein Cgig2_006548 [Carnegiea gigantea]
MENIGVLEVLRIVEEAMGKGIRGRRMWYSLKCNRLESLSLRRDGDVKKLMKGNDEYAYFYVAGIQGPCVGQVHGNEACEEQWGGGYIDCGRGGTMVDAAGEVARAVDGIVKLGLKVDERKMELKRWKNGVGDRIEKKLRKTLGNISSVAGVKLFNTAVGECGVLLTNNRSLVMNLAEGKCSYKWWQLKGLLCAHAMAVIDKQKLWVYDYVSDCYMAGN